MPPRRPRKASQNDAGILADRGDDAQPGKNGPGGRRQP